MLKPKVKIMNMAVSFKNLEEHMNVEEYCLREFECDLVTQLIRVCERWLEKAVIQANMEAEMFKNMLEKLDAKEKEKKESDPS